jgi:hypothetical protein
VPELVIETVCVLTLEEIQDISLADNQEYHVFCGMIDSYGDVTLYRMECDPITVPHEWFEKREVKPDFKDFQIIDNGRAVRLGECRVATGVIIDAWYANGGRW